MPSVAELRAKQFEATATTVRQALEADDLDDYGALLDSLTDDGDLRSIALAAIKLVHEASGATAEEPEIPTVRERPANDRGTSPGRRAERERRRRQQRRVAATRHRFRADQPRPRAGVRPADLVGAIANEAG